ncbi:MAG: RNA polymerase sigma factor [Acidimicrobiales bacterium]
MSQTVLIPADRKCEVDRDFADVYEAHYSRVVRALELGGLNRHDADDVAQEAFARTLGRWGRVRGGTNPPGYVYKTAFHLARRRVPREVPLVAEVAAPLDVAADTTTLVAAEQALAAMPPRRRSAAVLCLVLGLSTREAARSLGIAEGTVRKQVELARRSLRTALGEPAG